MSTTNARVPYRGSVVDVEYAWLGSSRHDAPLVVFLHEGLGSLSTWRDYPAELCRAGGFRGLVFSRPGYGRSTPRAVSERHEPSFMHRQAIELLPALLDSLEIDAEREPIWLLGHSDGGSIGLIFAATFPSKTAGLILLAPHIFVENVTVESIRAAGRAYEDSGLREKLLKHHINAESVFWGWNDIWLDPAFRSWNIEGLLPKVRCSILAVQGKDDEYGTLGQIEGIARATPSTELLVLDTCGHAVHRDQPEHLTHAVVSFIANAEMLKRREAAAGQEKKSCQFGTGPGSNTH